MTHTDLSQEDLRAQCSLQGKGPTETMPSLDCVDLRPLDVNDRKGTQKKFCKAFIYCVDVRPSVGLLNTKPFLLQQHLDGSKADALRLWKTEIHVQGSTPCTMHDACTISTLQPFSCWASSVLNSIHGIENLCLGEGAAPSSIELQD